MAVEANTTSKESRSTDDMRALLQRARQGEQEAFAVLYQRYHPMVLTGFMSTGLSYHQSWDFMQETFLHALRGLGSLDLDRPIQFGGWLSVIARNVARKYLAREGRAKAVQQTVAYFPEISDCEIDSAAEELGQQEEHSALMYCLDALDPEPRRIVIYKFVLKYSYRRIAPLMGLSAGTVRNRLADALQALRRCLGSKGVLPR